MNKLLWYIAIGSHLIGDIVTTYIGLSHRLMTEGNPHVLALYESFGLLPMLLILSILKVILFGVCYLVYTQIKGFHKEGIPLGIAFTGVFATLWNSYIILTTINAL